MAANADLRTFASSFIVRRMANDSVERWEPSGSIAERPATIFDLGWQGSEQRLIATIRYATNLGEDEDAATAVIIFEDVFCFNIFDENMDSSRALASSAAQLRVSYPYGGRWPFLEIRSSAWLAELAMRDGAWEPSEFRHLVITSRNMHLHVACRRLSAPTYHGAD